MTKNDALPVLKELKKNKKYTKASDNRSAVLLKGIGPLKNYDGEAGIGMVIVRILERDQLFNYLIMVTHWFCGTQLGGDRFKRVRLYVDHHIKNKIQKLENT